ncbi:hypothetical protein [Roseobacter fucihabitans]|uniref:hypothetical protein n=1 Tax=Roseobacter fucihabitans TaxID=1537242 RepID=UPI001CA34ABD|nr:hypothetical protein [Roseobacter litoralis]
MNSNIWGKKFASLCGLLALFGCSNQTELFFNTALIKKTPQGDTMMFSVSELVPSETAHICSLGAYFNAESAADLGVSDLSISMLKKVDIFPIPEGAGYFVYFDRDGKLLQSDVIAREVGDIRWRRSEDGIPWRCLDVQEASIRASAHRNYHQVSLEPLKMKEN